MVLVTDNLNTHTPGVPVRGVRAGAGAADRRAKLEWHYTPKHGRWLNVAECELAALSKQCLDRRIGSIETLRREVGGLGGGAERAGGRSEMAVHHRRRPDQAPPALSVDSNVMLH